MGKFLPFLLCCIFFAGNLWGGQFEDLLKMAEQGDAKSQFILGVSYEEGENVGEDISESRKWYLKAAQQGYADAQFRLGGIFYNGLGVEKNYIESAKWYRKAAEQGHVNSQISLGRLYEGGKVSQRDYGEARKWYELAAKQGSKDAAKDLKRISALEAAEVQKRIAEKERAREAAAKALEFTQLKDRAEKGDAEAQLNFGRVYAEGDGVPKDLPEAFTWFRKAAEQGNGGAQCLIGAMYKEGLGIEQNAAEAVKWFRKAAEQSDSFATHSAQYNLGQMYDTGEGVPKDFAEAAKWYRKAADQGNAFAQCALGWMYHEGDGVDTNYSEAVKWTRKAADQGNPDAQCNLGVMYTNGEGLKKDTSEAVIWFRKAAEQGHVLAQKNLQIIQPQPVYNNVPSVTQRVAGGILLGLAAMAQNQGQQNNNLIPQKNYKHTSHSLDKNETTLFDSQGEAVAYIAIDDELNIYLWNGTPVAYLKKEMDETHIFGFNGKHLGWFENGIIWNHSGHAVGFVEGAVTKLTKLERLKSLRSLTPLKSLEGLAPLKPLFTMQFSSEPLAIFLSLGVRK